MTPEERLQATRLLHFIDYEGPWERLSSFFFGVKRTGELRWEVMDGSLLDLLGCWADKRDLAWHRRHERRGTTPWRAWKRRPGKKG